MKYSAWLLAIASLVWASIPGFVSAQTNKGPSVLIVVAHPDDEAMFAGAVYKITHEMNGRADLALLSDGAGGYRFSTLAEPIYGLKLTDPKVAAEYLSGIRKQELMRGGRIIGLGKYFFFDQPDSGKIMNPAEFFGGEWDTSYVVNRLVDIMRDGHYDFAFVHLPVKTMHAHHKVATICALVAAGRLPDDVRPIVLGGWTHSNSDSTMFHWTQLEGYPITRVDPDPYMFNRSQPIGLDGRLNYNIIENWLIAEHKTQGTMQLLMARDRTELYFYFLANHGVGRDKTKALFDRLSMPPPAPTASQ